MSIFKQLHTISNDIEMPFDQKLEQLLDIGKDMLNFESGIVSSIKADTHEIYAVSPECSDISVGGTLQLPDNYCAANGVVAYHNIDIASGTPHLSINNQAVKSYIAAPIYVYGECFGTVSFSDFSPRQSPFSEIEHDYLLLVSTWVGSELEKQISIDNLNAQKTILEERNLLLEQITNLAGVGTWELDVETGALIWSGALKRMLHLHTEKRVTPEEVAQYIVSEKQKAEYISKFKDMIKNGNDFAYELEVLTDVGETRWLESRAHPIYEGGRCVKVIGATVDITQQHKDKAVLSHKTEQAQSALKARSEFMANMSHEIRTPIHGVQGMLEAVLNSGLSEAQRRHVNLAMLSADTLLNTVNDILDFTKIDAGTLCFAREAVDIANVIKEQVPMFERNAREKGLAFSVNTKPLEGHLYMGDRLRFGQLIINVLNNAIKFTDHGEVNVETSHVRYGKNHYKVKFIVTDTGIGMTEAQQRNAFAPFTQGESSSERKYNGTGLGLSIVSQIAKHYNGKIEISSHVGVGTRLTVTLSLDDALAVQNEKIADRDNEFIELDAVYLQKCRILIVEDNEINQVVIREQLKEIGLQADLAEDGLAACEKFEKALASKSPYTLVLMDCHMPVRDGYEATRVIREMGEVARNTPIIALTANALSSDKEKCLKSGMDDFISKPVGVSRLKECVFRHLSRQFGNDNLALKDPA